MLGRATSVWEPCPQMQSIPDKVIDPRFSSGARDKV